MEVIFEQCALNLLLVRRRKNEMKCTCTLAHIHKRDMIKFIHTEKKLNIDWCLSRTVQVGIISVFSASLMCQTATSMMLDFAECSHERTIQVHANINSFFFFRVS